MPEADVIVVRRERDVLPTQLGIAPGNDGDHVAGEIRGRRPLGRDFPLYRLSGRARREAVQRRTEERLRRFRRDYQDRRPGRLGLRIDTHATVGHHLTDPNVEQIQFGKGESCRSLPTSATRGNPGLDVFPALWPWPQVKHHQVARGRRAVDPGRRIRRVAAIDRARAGQWPAARRDPERRDEIPSRQHLHSGSFERGLVVELLAHEGHLLEVSAAFTTGLQPKPLELARDVFGGLEIPDGSRLPPTHRVVGEEEEPDSQILRGDVGGGGCPTGHLGRRGIGSQEQERTGE
jgi:hypothetical protein